MFPVCYVYVLRIAAVTTGVGTGPTPKEDPLGAESRRFSAAVCEDGGLACKNDPVDRF